jgi:hypothetical protein
MCAIDRIHANTLHRIVALGLVATHPSYCNAADSPDSCPRVAVDAHVLQQFQHYGPLSVKHEYFGFVYRYQGVIASAVVRSQECTAVDRCTLDTADAARLIPAGAKVLGEWHTHPHGGSTELSREDVRGAYNNRHIRCYLAYYGKPNGVVQAWDEDSS